MSSDLEQRIRERAYEIWENEGRPQGRGDEHWAQARAEFAEARSETGAAPKNPELQKASSPKLAASRATATAKPATAKAAPAKSEAKAPEKATDKGVAIATKEVAKSVKRTPAPAPKGTKRSPAARGTKPK